MQKISRIIALTMLFMALGVVPGLASAATRGIEPKQVFWYVKLRSIQLPPQSTNLGSYKFVEIGTGYTTYWTPPVTVLSTTADFTITYYPASGYVFFRWLTTGGCSVDSTTSNPTTLHVKGNGFVIALYRKA